jgi:GNAT superfamily N-acetyltransferase
MAIRCAPTVEDAFLASGAALVTLVSRHTGYPDPVAWPGDSLTVRVRERQAAAVCVWVAIDDDTGAVVGHALVAPANQPYWVNYPQTASLQQAGRLMELGALAVHPDWQRQGIATMLRAGRVGWLTERALTACAVAWENGPSDIMCRQDPAFHRLGRRVAAVAGHPVIDYVRDGSFPV